MTEAASGNRAVRTYGGWRRTRAMGLFGAGPGATVAVLGCVITPLLVAAANIRAGAITAVPAAAVVALTLARVDGISLSSLAQRRLRWTWGSAQGHQAHRAGAVVEHPGAWSLPGVLANTCLLTVQDGAGTFGLVWDQRSGHLTATLRCAAASTWLVDGDDADGWVGNWHAWLASLGYLPMVRWVAVTVDTAPEPGTTLQAAVLPRISAAAPADVQTLLREIVARSPAAAADIETRVSITFDPAASAQRHRELADHVAEVTRQLTGLESALSTCGVTVLGRVGAARLAAAVRVAFDPALRGVVKGVTSDGDSHEDLLGWSDAGPVAADEAWDHYRHDSGVSVTWGWREAPRQQVTSSVLTRLLSPGRFAKRVTLLYRPLPAGEAARLLEAEVNASAFREAHRKAQKRDETARDTADRERAHRAAQEEAEGSGVVLVSMYVTATVMDDDQLAEAVSDVESRADQSKIRLRRLYGAQSAGFATTLPVGFCPAYAVGRGRSR